MILPYFLLYIAFGLFPILFSLGVSFTSWDGIGEMTFVGLKNYVRVFTQDKYFYKSLWNTLILLGISTPIQNCPGTPDCNLFKGLFQKNTKRAAADQLPAIHNHTRCGGYHIPAYV